MSLEVTQYFMDLVRELKDGEDKMVHLHLEKNEKDEAGLANAGMTQLDEVLKIPEIMKEQEGEKGDAT